MRAHSLAAIATATVLLLLSDAHVAHADERAEVSGTPATGAANEQPPRNAISLQVMSLLHHGVNLEYERQVARRVSVVTSLGERWSGGDEYDTTETSFGAELRLWFTGRAPLTQWRAPAMVGPYVGFRVDVGLTSVSDGDRHVGSSIGVGESISLGARIVIARRFELTPAFGIGLREEADPRGRLATWTRFEPIRFGTTFGVMF